VRGQDIDEIFVAADLADAVSLREIGNRLRVLPQSVTLLPVGSLRELMKHNRVDLGSTVAVEMQRAALSQFELAQKRTVDVVCAFAGLTLLAPLLVATAVAVHLESPGPVLFRQTRHGFNGRPFKIFKFRTMRVLEDGAVIRQATAQDPRVTRVGRFLRRFSIDELPQLLNVLSGEMSLVGPRPHASAHDKHFSEILEQYAFRHHVKAGLTGWAQVNGARGETDTVEKMQRRVDLDIWYVNHWSIWLDFQIMFQTLRIVVSGENAH
jgi:Undecaprenyl-phosphate glucose phosphotransferase